LLCLILGAFAQVQKQVLDDYSIESPVLVIVISDPNSLPTTIFNTVTDSSILGGERDLVLEALTGPTGRVFTSGVSQQSWNIATPNGASGTATCQYDGIDGSATLNTQGLGGFDLTTSSSDSFKLTIQTDVATIYTINVYDTSSGTSTFDISVPANPGVENDYYVNFSTFTGNADFTKAGAVEVVCQGFDNVDTLVQIFALAGPGTTPPPPAATPSSSPAPGDTWYRFDDDDDGQSPCGEEAAENTVFLADNNIVYYYFYGLQRPYIYVSNPNNAALLVPSIFACILALLAL